MITFCWENKWSVHTYQHLISSLLRYIYQNSFVLLQSWYCSIQRYSISDKCETCYPPTHSYIYNKWYICCWTQNIETYSLTITIYQEVLSIVEHSFLFEDLSETIFTSRFYCGCAKVLFSWLHIQADTTTHII